LRNFHAHEITYCSGHFDPPKRVSEQNGFPTMKGDHRFNFLKIALSTLVLQDPILYQSIHSFTEYDRERWERTEIINQSIDQNITHTTD
jgi:hypothetical protein